MKKALVPIALAFALIAVAPAAFAASPQSTTIPVSATVIQNCTIGTPVAIAFGNYDTLASSNIDVTGSFDIRCTKNSSNVYIGLDNGLHGTRNMQDSGTNQIPYSLFSDSGRLTTWGNTLVSGVSPTFSSNASQTKTIYARTTQGAVDVPPGSYTDTVTATINF